MSTMRICRHLRLLRNDVSFWSPECVERARRRESIKMLELHGEHCISVCGRCGIIVWFLRWSSTLCVSITNLSLKNIGWKFSWEIWNSRASQKKHHTRSKICINKTTEQVSSFKYLGYHRCYGIEKDIPAKVTNFNYAINAINTIFKSYLVQKRTRIKAYKTLARLILMKSNGA